MMELLWLYPGGFIQNKTNLRRHTHAFAASHVPCDASQGLRTLLAERPAADTALALKSHVSRDMCMLKLIEVFLIVAQSRESIKASDVELSKQNLLELYNGMFFSSKKKKIYMAA